MKIPIWMVVGCGLPIGSGHSLTGHAPNLSIIRVTLPHHHMFAPITTELLSAK